MVRHILVVDDIRSNREILKNILADEYNIIEAAHGEEALAVMNQSHKLISAVLLDLGMPVMDGFEVLARMQKSDVLSQIPVIVTTGQTDSDSEERALQLGAKDYISKPYKSAIIKQRIRNTINLRETAATVNALRRDRLTGLYSREAFFEKATEMITVKQPGYYVMACFDIDNFKVLNDQYGTAKGDEILQKIAGVFNKGFSAVGGICCRIAADDFAVLYPEALSGSPELEKMRRMAGSVSGVSSPITFSIGRYVINDLTITPSAMYDRATLAAESVKGRYNDKIGVYDESMRDHLIFEQNIVTQMRSALQQRQFEVWFQPQYNHATGALIGAEALVRWRHPQQGLIPPGKFIPIFEKNGFVYELDKFVWEDTCRYLRKWQDEGRSPLPVSVNISRFDIFCDDLVDHLKGLIEKYEIPVDLLRLEITESAFAKSTRQVVDVVRQLIDFGFTVEIDDFGSGYSSLNTLKSVPAQVVKLDMAFLDDNDESQRGGNILESIVRMTKWLGMSVIAEGVEEIEQADFLKSIGCSYIQGYLYAKPMSAADYEEHCKGSGKEERLLSIETVENMDNNAFWNPKSMDTLIFSSYVGAACVYEYHNGKIEILRATDKYVQMLGGANLTLEDILQRDFSVYLGQNTSAATIAALEESITTRKEVKGEYLFVDIPGCPHETYLRSTMRVIASAGNRYLVYCISENITAQRNAEQSERKVIKQLQTIMDNVNCGITAVTMDGENVNYILSNDKYYQLLGYTREQYQQEVGSKALSTIFSEDVERVNSIIERVLKSGNSTTMEYRAVRRDGQIIHLRSNFSVAAFEGIDNVVRICTYIDVTAEKQAAQELLDNLPGGSALFEFDGRELTAVHINKRLWELVGREPENYNDLTILNAIHPDDRPIVLGELTSAILQNRDATCDIRILQSKTDYIPVHVVGRIIPTGGGKYSVYTSYLRITDDAMSIQEMLPIALNAVMENQTDFSFAKDRNLRYICCSKAVYEAAGLKAESEMIGCTDFDILDESMAQEYYKDDIRVMETGESVLDRVYILPSHDGEKHYASTSKFPLKDSKGNIIGIYCFGHDITEARAMKSQLEMMTNNIPCGIANYEMRDDRLFVTYFSDGLCRLLEMSREEYTNTRTDNVMAGVFDEDLPGLKKQIDRLIKTGEPVDLVYRVHTGDSYKWLNLRAVKSAEEGRYPTFNTILLDVTDSQQALERLRVSEEVNRLAISHSRNIVCRFDVASRCLTVAPGKNIFDIDSVVEDLPYAPVRAGEISNETTAAYISLFEGIINGSANGETVFQRNSTMGWRWLEARYSTIFSADGKPVSAVISYSDVTESIEKDAAYKKWQQSFANKKPNSYSLFRCNVSKKKIFDTVEGNLINMSFTPGGFHFDERTAQYVAKSVWNEDEERFAAFLNVDSLLASYYQGSRSVMLEYREKTGERDYRWLRLTVDLIEHPHSADVEAYLLFEDIDKAKRTELETIQRAENDPLTGVLNRATFAEKVNKAMENTSDGLHALLLLDIDGFKLVNDVFGHAVGDQALVDIANQLRTILRPDDLIGRLGGDEYVIFLPHIPSEAYAAGKAKQICALTRRDFSIEVEITGSVGITLAPRDGTDFDTLYKKVDAALYYVKGSGKDNYTFYQDDMADEHLEPEFDVTAEGQVSKKRRMLIVDDSRIDHAMLTHIFAQDFIVDKAKDGNTALIRLRHYSSAISVVLLDLFMPGMDGFAVLDKMRQSSELRNIPVIVVSGDENRETSLKAIRAGATDFVTKPVDPEVLRIRVQSAISKAENERLRAKNSFLEYENNEITRYKTVLERSGTIVIENDWINGTFTYDPSISEHIAGDFDDRKLWHILLADLVADTQTVRNMQELVHEIAADRIKRDAVLTVQLKTPNKVRHWFKMGVYKAVNEFGLTDKLYLTFNDIGSKMPDDQPM